MTHKLIKTDNYLLVVDDSGIEVGDYYWNKEYPSQVYKRHHYNTSSDYKKIIAHLPLNGSPILEGVDLLPPYSRHQEDGVEDLAKLKYPVIMRPNGRTLAGGHYDVDVNYSERSAYKYGYNKAREKYKYTEEDLRKALLIKHDGLDADYVIEVISNKYPTEFECEMEYDCCKRYVNCIGCDATEDMINLRPKTITTAQGVQWVGKYK